MPITELDIRPYVGEPVTQGTIDFLEGQLAHYKRKAAKQPTFKPFLDELVKTIAELRQEMAVQKNIV